MCGGGSAPISESSRWRLRGALGPRGRVASGPLHSESGVRRPERLDGGHSPDYRLGRKAARLPRLTRIAERLQRCDSDNRTTQIIDRPGYSARRPKPARGGAQTGACGGGPLARPHIHVLPPPPAHSHHPSTNARTHARTHARARAHTPRICGPWTTGSPRWGMPYLSRREHAPHARHAPPCLEPAAEALVVCLRLLRASPLRRCARARLLF